MTARNRLKTISLLAALVVVVPIGGSHAAKKNVPAWASEAVDYLSDRGLLDPEAFRANQPMARRDFKALITGAFGGGFSRSKGYVTVGEVGATLVRALERQDLAASLQQIASPDGWQPNVPGRFGTELVSREMGLRFNRPTEEESMEMAVDDKMRQADIAYSVWKAMTSPSTYSADALGDFGLDTYDATRREVIEYALSLVGEPYVWGGDWSTATSEGYPYGAQTVGGFDCSGFLWYVLQAKSSSYSPTDRPYKGWSLPERSSSDMAKATPKDERLGYKQLLPGDIVLFAPNGKDSRLSEVYHAALYLGKGWIVHSSGSRAGVSISSIAPGSWWNDQIVFGRRVIES